MASNPQIMAWIQKNIDDNKSSQINMGVEQVITTVTVLNSKLTYIYILTSQTLSKKPKTNSCKQRT